MSKIPAEIREHHDGIDSIFDPLSLADLGIPMKGGFL